jgi:hypothetical protein
MNYPEFEKFDLNKKEPSIATPDTILYTDKPDFEKIAIEWFPNDALHAGKVRSNFIKWAKKIWNDYCLPLQQQYNDLGVKYDKDLERWQERDVKQREEITKLQELVLGLREALKKVC